MPRSLIWIISVATLMLTACGSVEPEPTSTLLPNPTPIPTLTPTPTRVPNCPALDPNAAWSAPPDFTGYPDAIGNFLNAGGAADTLRTILTQASSINAQWGGVASVDLTGDGDPETVVSIFDPLGQVFGPVPSGMLLIYGCSNQSAPLLFRDTSQPMLQVKDVGDLVGAGRGGQVATVRSECGASTCFDTLDVLGWNGAGFVSLLGGRLQMPYPAYTFVNVDNDSALEVEAVSGSITSAGAGPPRTVKELWDWNGAQFVEVSHADSPPEYRIHVIHDADDRLLSGNTVGAIELYNRAISGDTLKDWLVEVGVEQPDDRANLSAYAWYRITIANVRRGDLASAQAALDRLNTDFPAGAPGHPYQQLAQVFWMKYQETTNLSEACLAANAHANSETDVLDGLNAFGYANREYVARDMCPFTGP
ncbi:MAG TPA: hypothetical protein VJG32_04610 [Anaerolineae bacterium]|nr:hypothetical protein [Anaerolineae bacterium]